MSSDRELGDVAERSGVSARKRGASKGPQARRITTRLSPDAPRETFKLTQRWRLIEAMIELSARAGHQGIGIAELCSSAGVSPVTFYQQFADKEEVLVAAYRSCAERTFGQMRSAVEGGKVSETPRLALTALLEAVASDPDAGRILFIEALGGGERMQSERERAFSAFERRAQEFLAATQRDSGTLDVPVTAVTGALRHVVCRHLRANAADQLPARLDDGLAWLYSYSRAPTEELWSTSPKAVLEGASEHLSPPVQASVPERLPPGNHGLPAGLVARSQRTRIIQAIAELTMAKGYAKTQIKDIVAHARVAKPVFYQHFSDKPHAFLEAQTHPTQHILDTCATAYFSADEWPERVWRMLETLLDLIVENPAISHLRLVECYAAGPAAIRRAEDITRSFTIFLEEGYRYRAQAASPPRLASQAIAGAIFEIVQRQVEQGEFATLTSHVPQLAYIAIAPFAGAERAIELVEEIKARESRGQRSERGIVATARPGLRRLR
jgi:AcrR family transcriptional regulator